MEPVEQAPPPETQQQPIPQPTQLTPEEMRGRQMNGFMQTSTSVLKIMFAGISRIVGEVFSMILKR